MIESAAIRKWRAEAVHEVILALLKDRFETLPRDVTRHLREVLDEKKLRKLTLLAAKCPDLATFRDAILS